jgi:hypothetical protein
VVLVIGELRVVRGLLACGNLRGDRGCMALMHGCNFGGARLDVDATVTAVVADAVGGLRAIADIVHDDIALIVVADAGADVSDGAIVIEVVPLPVASEEAEADVTEAVIDTAVEADMRSPVSTMEAVVDAAPAPVGRGPESAVVRRRNPFAGDPVVAVVTPGPVTGSPEVVGIGSGWLVVFGQRRRSLVGGDSSLGVSAGALVIAVVVGIVVVRNGSALLLGDGLALLLGLVGIALAEDGTVLAGGKVAHGRVWAVGVGGSVIRRGGGLAAGEAQHRGECGCGTGAAQEAGREEMGVVEGNHRS